jgi:hypothetical protein
MPKVVNSPFAASAALCTAAARMIGREHQHHGIRISRCKQKGRRGQGRCGIARFGLEDQRRRCGVDFAQLLGDEEPVLGIAHDHRRADAFGALHAQRGLLQHGLLADQRQKLFRQQLARQRPQPAAGAAAQDDGLNARFHRGVSGEKSSLTEPAG